MKAYDLISKPDTWIQNTFATRKNGRIVNAHDPAAECFCILGAISSAYKNKSGDIESYSPQCGKVQTVLKNKYDWESSISVWNDAPCRTQAEVIEVLKEADV